MNHDEWKKEKEFEASYLAWEKNMKITSWLMIGLGVFFLLGYLATHGSSTA